MKNIVLIGISGCGKSALGKALARKLKMPFVDMDRRIQDEAGISITELFATYGEEYFRDKETALSEALSQTGGQVISCGGGIVLRKKNMEALKRNGFVIFIDRNPSVIVRTVNCKNRPLLREHPEKLFQLHRERIRSYRYYADVTIQNSKPFPKTLSRLTKMVLKETEQKNDN